MIVTLSPTFISTQLILPPGVKKLEFRDSVVRGLLIELRSTPNSAPTWCLRQKVGGKNYFDYLGPVPDLTVAQARKIATQKKGERLALAKLAPEQKPAMGEMTLDVLWTDHYLPYAKIHKRSWARDEITYRIRIKPKFGDTKLLEITRYAVQQFQNELSKEKLSPASVDHHPKLMRRMLNLAVQWDMLDKNPLRGVQLLNVDNQIEHYLKEDELARLLEVLRTDENRTVCLLLMFLLCTGARSNEARQAKWSQIDTESAVWRIPASNSKSKKVRSVPLNESALWVLEQVGTKGTLDVVFGNPDTKKARNPVTRVWYRIRKKAGIPHMRIHDLRHSFASLLVSGGRSLFEVQQILGHSDPKVTMRYAHLSSKALQAAANTASVLMPKAAPEGVPEAKESEVTPATTQTAEVLQFPRAA